MCFLSPLQLQRQRSKWSESWLLPILVQSIVYQEGRKMVKILPYLQANNLSCQNFIFQYWWEPQGFWLPVSDNNYSQTKSVPHTPSSHRITGLRIKILPAYTVHLYHRGQNYDTQNLQREFWHNYPYFPSGKKKKTFTLECKQMFSGDERCVLTWNINDCLWGDTFSKFLLRNKLLLGLKILCYSITLE